MKTFSEVKKFLPHLGIEMGKKGISQILFLSTLVLSSGACFDEIIHGRGGPKWPGRPAQGLPPAERLLQDEKTLRIMRPQKNFFALL